MLVRSQRPRHDLRKIFHDLDIFLGRGAVVVQCEGGLTNVHFHVHVQSERLSTFRIPVNFQVHAEVNVRSLLEFK